MDSGASVTILHSDNPSQKSKTTITLEGFDGTISLASQTDNMAFQIGKDEFKEKAWLSRTGDGRSILGSDIMTKRGYVIVTNPVHALPFTHHQRSLVHHIDSYTTLLLPFTIELHFPSSTALTQLFALITLTPENYLTITITQSHTLYKPGTSSRITQSTVSPATLQSVHSLPC